MAFMIKAEVRDPQAKSFTFTRQKTMYGGELKRFKDWNDGRPETELNFKFYRQATNKIAGISAGVAAYLEKFF